MHGVRDGCRILGSIPSALDAAIRCEHRYIRSYGVNIQGSGVNRTVHRDVESIGTNLHLRDIRSPELPPLLWEARGRVRVGKYMAVLGENRLYTCHLLLSFYHPYNIHSL